MKNKILFLLLSTFVLMNVEPVFGFESPCTTSLECALLPARVEQQHQTFSQPDLFSLPFFDTIPDFLSTGERAHLNACKQWHKKFQAKQDKLQNTIRSGLLKKLAWAQYADKTSSDAQAAVNDAKDFFLKAAENGSVTAMSLLSDIYGQEQNCLEAIYWAFLGLEVNWITTGTISEPLYKNFQEYLSAAQLKQVNEIYQLPIVINYMKEHPYIPELIGRLRLLFDSICPLQDKPTCFLLSNYQMQGILNFCTNEYILKLYKVYLQDFPIVRSDLSVGSPERMTEIYNYALKVTDYYEIAGLLRYNEFNLDEKRKSVKSEDRNIAIGRLYAKSIKKSIPNLISHFPFVQKQYKQSQCESYMGLGTLIYEKKYDKNENGIPVTDRNRTLTAISLLNKAVNLGSREAIEYLSIMISQDQCDFNEWGQKISSQKERSESLGRLYYKGIENGHPIFSGFLASLIMNGFVNYDQDNKLIPESQRAEIALQLYFNMAKHCSFDPSNVPKSDQSVYIPFLSSLAQQISDKKINVDEKNQLFPEEKRSEIASHLFNQSIDMGNYDSLNDLAWAISTKKIYHGRHGVPIESEEDSLTQQAVVLRECIQKDPKNKAALCSFVRLTLNKELSHDENNNLILDEHRLEWAIEKLEGDILRNYPRAKVSIALCLLNKNNDLKTERRAYELMQTAFFQGETEHLEYMIGLKELIDLRNSANQQKKASVAKKKKHISLPKLITSSVIHQEKQFPALETQKNVKSTEVTKETSSHHFSGNIPQTLPFSSTSSTSLHVESPEERAIRKAQAKAAKKISAQQDHLNHLFKTLKKRNKVFKHHNEQKYQLVWDKKARDDFNQLLAGQQRNVAYIIDTIKNSNNPYEGAEKLKSELSRWFSHRINDEHRFVFKISEDKTQIIVKSCFGHY